MPAWAVPWIGPAKMDARLSSLYHMAYQQWVGLPPVRVSDPSQRPPETARAGCWAVACQVCKCEGMFGWRQWTRECKAANR